MKQITSIFLFIFSAILLINCKGEEEELKILGKFKVAKTEYNINEASAKLYKATDNTSTNNYQFEFTNKETKTIKKIKISLHYPKNDLVNGTYVLASKSKEIDGWFTSYTETTDKYVESFNNLKSGTVTLTKKDNTHYKVVFKFVPENNVEISGEFDNVCVFQEY